MACFERPPFADSRNYLLFVVFHKAIISLQMGLVKLLVVFVFSVPEIGTSYYNNVRNVPLSLHTSISYIFHMHLLMSKYKCCFYKFLTLPLHIFS